MRILETLILKSFNSFENILTLQYKNDLPLISDYLSILVLDFSTQKHAGIF